MINRENQNLVPEEELNDENLTNDQEMEEVELDENANVSENESDDLQTKYDELNNSYLRLHAEFDNYRKRTIKEKADLIKNGGEKVLIDILPVVDDFERALENIDKVNSVDAIKEGVELIYNKLVSFLAKNGVKEMDVIGKPFDLELHEALTTIPAQTEDMKDRIVDCVQKGYTLGDKVIRYPKVIVAK